MRKIELLAKSHDRDGFDCGRVMSGLVSPQQAAKAERILDFDNVNRRPSVRFWASEKS